MTTNDASNVYRKLSELQIVPVLAIESIDQALPLADALLAGGLPVAEVTFRTKAAPDVIRRLAEDRPQLLIGAGTVTSLEQVAVAKECGARFAMAPGLNPNVVRAAQKAGLPFVPGVMTPSDIEAAMELGLEVLKFFPAGAAGGAKMLKSISAPYAHLGTKFIPTGGITDRNMTDYLALDEVLAVGGTWIATRSDLAEGRWEEISKRCQSAIIGVSQLL